jgi:serine/threonine protein phosphatase PrpC
MPFSCFSAQGDRPEQQDRFVARELPGGALFFAVMDGHGGAQTADLLARDAAAVFETALAERRDPVLALRETVRRLTDITAPENAGSTLSMVYIPAHAERAYAAVLGDSPVLIKDPKGVPRISPLHNARSNPQECESAVARGARYVEGYLEDPEVPGHGLQLSRALGDRALTRILNRDPEVYSVPLGKPSWVLLATDGVLDSFEEDLEEQLRRLADEVESGRDAQAVAEAAVRRGTGDNVTVIVWRGPGLSE